MKNQKKLKNMFFSNLDNIYKSSKILAKTLDTTSIPFDSFSVIAKTAIMDVTDNAIANDFIIKQNNVINELIKTLAWHSKENGGVVHLFILNEYIKIVKKTFLKAM